MIHLISGDELIERTEAPEKMSLVQLRDYLCIGKSSSEVHNCSGLKQIYRSYSQAMLQRPTSEPCMVIADQV